MKKRTTGFPTFSFEEEGVAFPSPLLTLSEEEIDFIVQYKQQKQTQSDNLLLKVLHTFPMPLSALDIQIEYEGIDGYLHRMNYDTDQKTWENFLQTLKEDIGFLSSRFDSEVMATIQHQKKEIVTIYGERREGLYFYRIIHRNNY